jgi:sigma-B regulation protein RsbU (phosphoserine phosphatase)
LFVGAEEPQIEGFEDYEDNGLVPPTISHSEYGWLCTTCRPLVKEDGISVGLVCVDIDMNNIVHERRWILFNSALLIIIITTLAIVTNMDIIRRVAIKPLRDLQKKACGFTEGAKGYTKENVIKLDLRSNDEINDLYQEIRQMQENIVDYTQDLERVTAEREHIRTELDLASQIQRNALPEIDASFSERDEFVLAASMDPAKWVGGDFYDFFYLDENRLALVIADVSGKGIPAAMFMMSAKNKISGRASSGGTPAEILTDVNLQLCRNNHTHMFVTVWLGILDLRTGVISACNAGHEEPAIRGKDGVFRLYQDPHGFVLGGRKRSKYTDYEIKLNPGDTIFVYTDGITEAADDNQTFYEDFRMVEALNQPGLTGPDEIIAAMKQSVQSFANGAEQADDLTMLCLLYRGPNTDQSTETAA